MIQKQISLVNIHKQRVPKVLKNMKKRSPSLHWSFQIVTFELYTILQKLYVAVTGRNQTLFLSLFGHFFGIHVFVTMSYSLPECLKLAYSNSYICAVSTPTLAVYVQSIALGELIELS